MRGVALAGVGSRTFRDYRLLCDTLDALHHEHPVRLVVSGGARGADQLAERWARENELPLQVLRPQWRDANGKLDRSAGLKRNSDIVAVADTVVAFWDGISTGTRDSIRKAQACGKELRIVRF